MDSTGISWTQSDDGRKGATWNPTDGCNVVSPGCKNCYAMRMAGRFSGPGKPYEGLVTISSKGKAVWNGTGRLNVRNLAKPLRWKRARRVFVNSMSDLFWETFSNEDIAAVFGVMAACPQHTFQILTKRARRMREWFEWIETKRTPLITIPYSPRLTAMAAAGRMLEAAGYTTRLGTCATPRQWPLPNVWMGVSVEDRKHGVPRIDELRRVPAAVRFLSCEPLIEDLGQLDLTEIDWLIAGCESGPGSRRCEVAWLRSLREQAKTVRKAFFLKQANVELEKCSECGRSIHYHAHSPTLADASCGCTVEGAEACSPPPVACGEGSKKKSGGVVELPYLDGAQHKQFPIARAV